MLESSRHAPRTRNRRPSERLPQLVTLTRLTLKQGRQLKTDIELSSLKLSPKKIHRLRVLSRRNRASLEILGGMAPRVFANPLKILQKLTRKLGQLRSLDVYRKDLKKLSHPHDVDLVPASAKLQNYLDKKLKKSREARHRQLRIWAKRNLSKRLHPETLKEDMVHCDSGDFYAALQQQEKITRERLKRRWIDYQEQQDLTSLHEVRIALKRWRYLLELQEECLPTAQKNPIPILKQLQDAMGSINDSHSLHHFLLDEKIRKKIKKQKLMLPYQTLVKKLETELQHKIKAFKKKQLPQLKSLMEGALF